MFTSIMCDKIRMHLFMLHLKYLFFKVKNLSLFINTKSAFLICGSMVCLFYFAGWQGRGRSRDWSTDCAPQLTNTAPYGRGATYCHLAQRTCLLALSACDRFVGLLAVIGSSVYWATHGVQTSSDLHDTVLTSLDVLFYGSTSHFYTTVGVVFVSLNNIYLLLNTFSIELYSFHFEVIAFIFHREKEI